MSGEPKQYSKGTDAGNTMVSYFCDGCGTTLWRVSSGYPVRVRPTLGGFEICLLTEGLGNHVSEGDLCWDAVGGDFVDGVLGRYFGCCFG